VRLRRDIKTGRSLEDIYRAGSRIDELSAWQTFVKLRRSHAAARRHTVDSNGQTAPGTEQATYEANVFAFNHMCGHTAPRTGDFDIEVGDIGVSPVPVNILTNFVSAVVPSAADFFAFQVR